MLGRNAQTSWHGRSRPESDSGNCVPVREGGEQPEENDQSVTQVNYSFRGKLRFPRKPSNAQERDRIRSLTPRRSGASLETMSMDFTA